MKSLKISNLGEFGLIDLINKRMGTTKAVKGIGDDTAVVSLLSKKDVLLTTDMLIEGTHFLRSALPKHIGHKAIACSISDIASMGGIPKYALVSLGVPATLSSDFVLEMYQGMKALAKKFKCDIVGGDTVKSERVVINVAMAGEVKKGGAIYRGGAKVGDEIFVTGKLGGSLKSGRHLTFTPRVLESQYLVKNFKPTSMIDISDGLTADLGHILRTSQVGAVLEEECIPRERNVTLKQALCDGEDFELLFTLSKNNAKKLLDLKQKRFSFYRIGTIVEKREGLRLQDKKGKMTKIAKTGYVHF